MQTLHLQTKIRTVKILEEIARRRTFGIVSHPDAGKTTLTEKLLLFGGAIQEAGAVKNNKIKKTATSDFMEIEKQRGISVATSVMAFEYKNRHINILDTPGHQDFAEDTFRTLTAVDSAIVVVVPLIVPITLIRHHVMKHEIPYLKGQLYLEPHPKELMLRNRV